MTETLKSMKPGWNYIVVTGTECGTFENGDRVSKSPDYFEPDKMDILLQQREGFGSGWMDQWEWSGSEFSDVRVEIDMEYYKERVVQMKKELARLKKCQ